MNESIFEGNLFGNGSIAGTPADEDVEEFIDIPEADDESSSEGDTPGGNILELLSRMRGLMPNSDGDEDMDDNDMDSDDYHKLKNNWFSMWYILMCLTTRKIRGDSCHGLCEVF